MKPKGFFIIMGLIMLLVAQFSKNSTDTRSTHREVVHKQEDPKVLIGIYVFPMLFVAAASKYAQKKEIVNHWLPFVLMALIPLFNVVICLSFVLLLSEYWGKLFVVFTKNSFTKWQQRK